MIEKSLQRRILYSFSRAKSWEKNGCAGGASTFWSPISDGKWHHIVCVKGSIFEGVLDPRWGEDALYIDGEQVSGRKSPRT